MLLYVPLSHLFISIYWGPSSRQALCCVLRQSKLGVDRLLETEKPQGSLAWGDRAGHGSRAAAGEASPAVSRYQHCSLQNRFPAASLFGSACTGSACSAHCALAPWRVSPGDDVLGGGGGRHRGTEGTEASARTAGAEGETAPPSAVARLGACCSPCRRREKLSPGEKVAVTRAADDCIFCFVSKKCLRGERPFPA